MNFHPLRRFKQHLRSLLHDPHRRRGSILMLAVAVLLIIVLMGTAYMQVARVDRRVMQKDFEFLSEDIVTVIAQILQDDLKDDQGRFFNPTPPADPADATDPNAGGGDEPFDYPYTNYSVNKISVPDPFDPTTELGPAAGNANDDMWLASISTEGAAGSEEWPHITNLFGYYLEFDNSTGQFALNTDDRPVIELVDGSDAANNSDTDLSVDNTRLADADGDGIPDSRWTYAPLPEVSGRTFVVAVRIVDNSAMANANVATAMSDPNNAYSVDEAPRWWNPSELNLTGWARQAGQMQEGDPMAYVDDTSGSGGLFDDMAPSGLLAHRIGVETLTPWDVAPTGLGDNGERFRYWKFGPSEWHSYDGTVAINVGPTGPPSTPDMSNEAELRYHNGLNNSLVTTALEQRLSDMLRSGATEDTATWTGTPQGYTDEADYFDGNPRLYTTSFSGAAPLFVPGPGESVTTMPTRANVQMESAGILQAAIQNAIVGTGLTTPPGMTETQFADQLAASIKDYSDWNVAGSGAPTADNVMTRAGTRYGLETLPFIVEVYAEREYESTQVSDSDGDTVNEVQWDSTTEAVWAVELRNPFDRPIPLTNAHLVFVDGGGSETDLGELDDGTGSAGTFQEAVRNAVSTHNQTNNAVAAGDPEEFMLFPGDGLVIHHPNAAPRDLEADGDIDTSGNDVAVVSWTQTWPVDPGLMEVQLRGYYDNAGTATLMTTPYCMFPTYGMPASETFLSGDTAPQKSSGASPPADGTVETRIVSSVGAGEGVQHISYQLDSTHVADEDPRDVNASATAAPELGQAVKGGTVTTGIAATDVLWMRNSPYGMASAGEVMMVAAIGPTDTETVGELWSGGAVPLSSFRIDPTDTTVVDNSLDNYNVPVWMLLAERFTNLTTKYDSSGDPVAPSGPEDNLVSGTVNLNTIRQDVLESVLPIPDATDRAGIAQAIIDYRNATARGAISRTGPGIAYLHELWAVLSGGYGGDTNPNDTLADGAGNNIPIKFEMDGAGELTPYTTPVGEEDLRDEQALPTRWLSQVASTRSDTFTAYILIRGYDDFTQPPDEEERLIVVYDRSQVTDGSDLQVVFGEPAQVP